MDMEGEKDRERQRVDILLAAGNKTFLVHIKLPRPKRHMSQFISVTLIIGVGVLGSPES